jgi:coenzyme F420-0:L-glutamate ligase / coenzyme F420-1:gamma-L-glutamate ligase
VATELHVFAVPGIPEARAGDEPGALIADAIERAGLLLSDGDVLVIAQKLVSKAEGAVVDLGDVRPSAQASAWAVAHGKDAAITEVVLRESRRIVRMERGVIIAETNHGFVCANAGVDSSNVEAGRVTILPRDSDRSAIRAREIIEKRFGRRVATIVADTFGRPWREGVVNVALGVSGLRPLDDLRGSVDWHGRTLHSTIVAVADEIASAAELVMGKVHGRPAAIVRGAGEWAGEGAGVDLRRQASMDMFR